jgi:hypothetical protein
MLTRALAIVVGLTASAIAQPGDAKSDADRLFEEGRKLLADGKADAACEKFQQSIAKDPRAVGTLLNLALCNEQRGKIATALGLYREALERATEASLPKQQKAAQEKVLALSPRVPVLVITYAAEPVAGTTLVIDDGVVPLTIRELPLDPGAHAVVLTAPGRLPFQTRVELAIETRMPLALPALELPATKTRIVVERVSWRRTYGKPLAIGGGALAAIAAGALVVAKRSYDKQHEDPDGPGPLPPHCDANHVCDGPGEDAANRARGIALGAVITGSVALVALATGSYLWITAPERVRVTPAATAGSIGVSLSGSF